MKSTVNHLPLRKSLLPKSLISLWKKCSPPPCVLKVPIVYRLAFNISISKSLSQIFSFSSFQMSSFQFSDFSSAYTVQAIPSPCKNSFFSAIKGSNLSFTRVSAEEMSPFLESTQSVLEANATGKLAFLLSILHSKDSLSKCSSKSTLISLTKLSFSFFHVSVLRNR